MGVSIIVACDKHGVIGKEGKLPWRCSEDLKIFRKRTLGHAVIMGRKTWDSLPKKPLDGRPNIILTRNQDCLSRNDFDRSTEIGPFYFDSLKGAIKTIRCAWNTCLVPYRDREIYVIGGAQVYREALEQDVVDKIFMSKIKGEYDGDTFFPQLNEDWVETATDHRKDFQLSILTNKRLLRTI